MRRRVRGFLLDNVRGLLFVVGAIALYHGLAGVSRPAANIVLGVVCMGIGAAPYLRKRKA